MVVSRGGRWVDACMQAPFFLFQFIEYVARELFLLIVAVGRVATFDHLVIGDRSATW